MKQNGYESSIRKEVGESSHVLERHFNGETGKTMRNVCTVLGWYTFLFWHLPGKIKEYHKECELKYPVPHKV
jgi:hypothetical protein